MFEELVSLRFIKPFEKKGFLKRSIKILTNVQITFKFSNPFFGVHRIELPITHINIFELTMKNLKF